MDGDRSPTQHYFSHSRPEMQQYIPAQRERVLEIGCGEGRFIASLSGVEERWGIEPSSAAQVASVYLTHILSSTFEEAEAELPLAYFDVVICNDVIEHMPNHVSFLLSIQKYIAPGGMLVGSIPNVRYYKNLFQMLLEKDWHYTDSGILDRTHMAFFTQKSLRKTLERNGFRVVCLQGTNAYGRQLSSNRDRVYYMAAHALSWISLGYFSDLLFMQFAFQAIPNAR